MAIQYCYLDLDKRVTMKKLQNPKNEQHLKTIKIFTKTSLNRSFLFNAEIASLKLQVDWKNCVVLKSLSQ